MSKKLALTVAAAAAAISLALPLGASAGPLQPACVVVSAPPLNLQLGYAPNGPSDCVHLP